MNKRQNFRRMSALLIVIAGLASSPTARAVDNDNFASAWPISATPYSTNSSNVDATREAGEPYHYGSTNGHSVWWTWTSPASGPMRVDSVGSSFRSVMAVYTGTSVSGLTQVSAGRGNHIVDFVAVAGTTYQIALDCLGADPSGNFTFRLQTGVPPPANDAFTNATVITGNSYNASSLNNAGATKEAGEPAHAGDPGGKSLWWKWTAPATGTFQLDTAGSSLDTLLAVYTGNSVTNLSLVSSNDNYTGFSSLVTFSALAGTNYWFAVDGWQGREGLFNLNLTPPFNDMFTNATVITLTGNYYGANGVFNTNATKEAGEPNHAGNSGGKSLWWDWTAPANGMCHVDTIGSAFNTLLGVYTGSVVSSLTAIASNDDSPNMPPASEVSFSAFNGTTYHIAVDGYNGASGWITMNLIFAAAATGGAPAAKVAGGGNFAMFLKSDGALWDMGYNGFGQLGNGTFTDVYWPAPVVLSNSTAIAAGGFHSLFLKKDGSLWAMGMNGNGQLGDGTLDNTNRPEQTVATNVTAISAGARHSLFLKNNGSLWAMGQNNNGQLGDGTFTDTNRPEQVVASGVMAISAGFSHSLFIKTNGSLWGMGLNNVGQLGDGNYSSNNIPEQIVASNVTAVAAGVNFSLFVKRDGSLWGMGVNNYGQLGDGTTSNTNLPEQIVASNVTAIAAGSGFSLFRKNDGSLWAMGLNNWGQLGDGTTNNVNLPEKIVAGGVTAIAAGWTHSLFLKNDGSLWGMGYQASGRLGDGFSGNTFTNLPELIVAQSAPPGYNLVTGALLSGGNMRLSYVGNTGTSYALDRSFSLSPANWIPQVTNPADSGGMVIFTNNPDPTTNNFWRVRSAP